MSYQDLLPEDCGFKKYFLKGTNPKRKRKIK